MLIQWLNTSGWISKYAASGHKIYLEDGNEAWNTGTGATLYYGNGMAYGYTLGLNMAAAKSAAGYDPKVVKLVGNSLVAPNQGYGPYGWVQIALSAAQGTPNGLPDFVDVAPYTLNYLGTFDTSGSSVATTGAPFLDEWAEDANLDSVTTPPPNSRSMYLNQQYAKAKFGVGTLVYEVNQNTIAGVAATQSQLDQIGASVGNALAVAEHILLMQRDAHVTGPIHAFTLAKPHAPYTCNGSDCESGAVMPLGGNLFMGTGPGQAPGSANTDRPLAIALRIINNAIGSNSNLMSVTQPGTRYLQLSRRPGPEGFAHHSAQPCGALCELLRLQQRAGKLDHDLLQQQPHQVRVRVSAPGLEPPADLSRRPSSPNPLTSSPTTTKTHSWERGRSACRCRSFAILHQRQSLFHSSSILHRPHLHRRGTTTLTTPTFSSGSGFYSELRR